MIKMENKDKYFATRDFYLACFLRAKGVRLIRAIKQNKITTFHFENNNNIESLTTNFYNDSEMVSALKFIEAVRALRAYSYNIKNTI